MSAEEFIYSVINTDNVAQLDLNVIANTLASADSLIRQIKAQQVENAGLKEKITSLRSSALQIKQLYEAEVGKNQGIVNREKDYVRKVKELETRVAAVENARINAELQGKETVADLERTVEHWRNKYDALALDMVRNCCLLADNGLLSSEQQTKARDWKSHVQGMVQDGKDVPEDVLACLNKKRPSRKKRKSEVECRDQATMTIGPSFSSIGVNTMENKPLSSTASTCTAEDLEQPVRQYSITDDIFPEEQEADNMEALPKKVFADKSTMYCSSTVTRSTCTSAFIKRVDVGTNFPEVIPKSINDILRECVIELPSLLSPILDEVPIRKESACTQTDPLPVPYPPVPKPSLITTGTNTNLRNIRRKVDYARKKDGSLVNNLLSFIKKEENISPVGSLQNIPSAVFHSELSDHLAASAGGVNPQLTHIWGLLGETMFRLLATGRMFDSQCHSIINERIAMINNLIESESRRGTAMMSEVFAAAAASAALVSDKADTVVGMKNIADGGGGEGAHDDGLVDRTDSLPNLQGKCMNEYEEEAVEDRLSPEESNSPWEDSRISPQLDDAEIEPIEDDEEVVDDQIQTGEVDNSSNDAECSKIPEEPATPYRADEISLTNSSPLAEEYSNQTKEQFGSPPSSSPLSPPPPDIPGEPLVPDKCSFDTLSSHTDESNEFRSLMESNEGVAETKDGEQQEEEEPDEIANELRQMEEGFAGVRGDDGDDDARFPCLIRVRQHIEEVEPQKHYLNVITETEESSGAATDDENDYRMSIVETSPSRLSASSSCTSIGSNGTLISPIKVKETNELVKDQFKTPTSPAISKRKLRERLEGGPSKRGRLSPTTESLLEDDWDQKFSRIKNYFTLPSSLNPIQESKGRPGITEQEPNSEVDDILWDCDDAGGEAVDDNSDEMEEFMMPDSEPILQQPLRLETSIDQSVAIADSPESPTEETSSSSWDGFKRPLRIDVGYPIDPIVITNTPASPDSSACCPNDSPMSPIADKEPVEANTGRNFSQSESPLSPPLDSCGSSIYAEHKEPRVIPLENPLANRILSEVGNTPIGKAIACYKEERRAEVILKLAAQVSTDQSKLIQKVTKVVQEYLKDEWTVVNLNNRCTQVLHVSRDTKTITLGLIECVVSHTKHLEIDVQCSPPAPPLPRITQQLVVLAKTLNETLFTLDKILLQEVDRRVFNLKSGKINLEEITALTYLYVGIADSNRLYGCTARMYIYKCLYYFKFQGLPLIYYVLKAFPHALPKKVSVHYDNSDAMVSTIRTILMNLNYMINKNHPEDRLYKKCELLKLLTYFYGYQQGSPTYDELIINLVEKIKANKLKNVDYCLILIAKRQGYEWAKVHIVQKHLYPLLNNYLKQIQSEQQWTDHDNQIRCLIFAISAILKTQPNYQDVTGVMQIFGSIIQRSDGNQRVQEAAVAGLMRFSRFDYTDIYEWLCKWRPKYEVSGRIKLMLATFVHRKQANFWKRLSQRKIV